MKPSKISVLGFQFYGGSEDGCIFALYPECLKDMVVMINDAKDFLRNSGSKWAEMTMLSRDGQKEVVNLYLEQDKMESAQKADFQDTNFLGVMNSVMTNVMTNVMPSVEDDPYQWSFGN
jgi:hypothetical protein